MGGYTAHRVSDSRKPAPDQALAVLATLSDVPTEVLQSRTQARAVGRVRAAAAHVRRVDCNLKVKDVAPLLGRTGIDGVRFLAQRSTRPAARRRRRRAY